MRTILFWLLPLYNLFTAAALVRQLAFHDADAAGTTFPRPHRAAVWLSWLLGAAAIGNLLVVRDARFMVLPYVLFVLNLLASWRFTDRPRARRRAALKADAGVGVGP